MLTSTGHPIIAAARIACSPANTVVLPFSEMTALSALRSRAAVSRIANEADSLVFSPRR